MSEHTSKFRVSMGTVSIVVMLIIQLVLFAFGYGALIQQVRFNRELIQTYQTNQLSIMTKLDDVSTRLTRLETILNMER